MPADKSLDSERAQQAADKKAEADLSTVAHEQATQTHGQGAGGATRGGIPIDLPSHPDYEITREIARGGMGRVLAGREIVLDREVAIKTLLPGANAARFVTEAKITARLPHPGIPPVYALGTMVDGSPFLAMKLVRGRTLADELNARTNLESDLSRFVQIFEQIAQAVGFAHAQGIIHRDLKPANIMVGAFGEVQVMDWGLARRLSDSGEESANETASEGTDVVHTQAGAIIGTPAYMAPEQARGESLDARADVFALGGILAAILTGRAPFQGTTVMETVTKAASADLQDIITRLQSSDADEELIAIALQCLQASPPDRPADAEQLASQVSRYWEGVDERLRQAEADKAASDAKAAEQLKRRRVVRLAAGIVIGVLILGIIGTSIGLVLANRARIGEADRAEGEKFERRRAEKEKEDAVIARNSAQNRLTQIEKGNLILTSIFKDLDIKAVEQGDLDLKVVLARRLIDAAEQLDGESIGDPLVVAELQTEIANSLFAVGFFLEARELSEKALTTRERLLAADDPGAIGNMHDIALCYRSEGRFDEAATLMEHVCERRKAMLGPDDPLTLHSLSNLVVCYRFTEQLDKAIELGEDTLPRLRAQLGNENKFTITCLAALATSYMDKGQPDLAMPLFEEAVELSQKVFGPKHPETIVAESNLTIGFQRTGQWNRALPRLEATLQAIKTKMGPDHPDTLTAMQNLAIGYLGFGRTDLALPVGREVLALRKSKLGDNHVETLTSMSDLGAILDLAGELEEAETLLRESLELMQAQLEADDANLLDCMNRLAVCLSHMNKTDEAIALMRNALQLTRQKLGEVHPATLVTMNDFAVMLQRSGKADEALPLLKENLEATRALRGADHPETLTSMDNLAQSYMSAGQLELAIPLFEKALKLREEQFGRESMAAATTCHNLAWAYLYAGKAQTALPYFQETWEFMKGNFSDDHPAAIVSMGSLANCHLKLGQLDRAKELYQEELVLSKEKLGPQDSQTLTALTRLGEVCLKLAQPVEAETYLDECLAIAKETRPDKWQRFETQSLLGGALVGQSKFEEAEPLLLEAYAGLKDRESSITEINRVIIVEAADRLVDLYEATNNAEELQKWQAERETMQRRLSEPEVPAGN